MEYAKQPPKDFKTTMDYKNAQIRTFNDAKQESMRIFSSGRDATEIVVNCYKDLTEEQLKAKILDWRKWFYTEIYGHNEEFYKSNNSPF